MSTHTAPEWVQILVQALVMGFFIFLPLAYFIILFLASAVEIVK